MISSKMRRFENFRSIFPYIIIVLASVLVFTKPLGNSDELWNYNFAINILDGNLPYKDFSIVQTPLSCYISAFFMLIFGRGLLSFKVLTYVLFVVTSALVFDLSKKTSGNSVVAICATAVTMSAHFLCYIYNYNYLTALVILVILEIEYIKKDTFGANLLVGLLVGTTILIKQNTGLIIWIANLFICIWRYFRNSKNKTFYFCRLLASILPFLIYVGYLVCVGCFQDFIDYAVYGITTFTHRYTLIDFCVESSFFIPYLVLIIIMFGTIGVRVFKRNTTDFQVSSIAFSVAWASIMFPLADPCHVMSVMIPLVPTYLAFVDFEKVKRKEVWIALVVGVFALQSMFTFSLPFGVDFYRSTLKNYEGIFIDKVAEDAIQDVNDYIRQKETEGYRVRIADVSGVAYKIPLDNYEKNWDMLLVGNLGSNTVEDLLESDRPALYLLIKDESLYGLQDHYELLDYIKTNYEKVDEIRGFYVYESNEKINE